MLTLLVALIVGQPANSSQPVVVQGSVSDDNGLPVAGASVYFSEGWPAQDLKLPFLNQPLRVRPPVLGQTQSAADGSFRLQLPAVLRWRHVSEPPWLIWVVAEGKGLTIAELPRHWPADGPPIQTQLTEATERAVQVLDPEGTGVSQASLSPAVLGDRPIPEQVSQHFTAHTDERGETILRGWPASQVQARVTANRFGIQRLRMAPAVSGETVLELLPTGRVHGKIVGNEEAPRAGISIDVQTRSDPYDSNSIVGVARVTTNAEGHFEIPAIAAGVASLRVNLALDRPYRLGQGPGESVVTAGQSAEATYSLIKAVAVRGVVTEEKTDQPIAGALIELGMRGVHGQATTNEQGEFSGFVSPGMAHYFIRAVPGDYYSASSVYPSQPVKAVTEPVQLKPLVMARGTSVGGMVVDENEQPVAGAEVIATWQAGVEPVRSSAWTDRDGKFTLRDLHPRQSIRVTARAGLRATAHSVALKIEPGAENKLKVEPDHSISLSGRVVDPDGKPLVGVPIRLASGRWLAMFGMFYDTRYVRFPDHPQLISDRQGRFQTPATLDRNLYYQVLVDSPDYLRTITAWNKYGKPTNQLPSDIVLHATPRLTSVRGRIIDTEGRPIAGARVWQTGAGPQKTASVSAADGQFQLHAMATGQAIVLVTADGYRRSGRVVDVPASGVDVTLRALDQPLEKSWQTLPPAVSSQQLKQLVWPEFQPILQRQAAKPLSRDKLLVATTAARIAPDEVLGFVDDFAQLPELKVAILGAAAEAWVGQDLDAATELIAETPDSHWRATLTIQTADALRNDPARRMQLLASALVTARAVAEPGNRLESLGRIATRLSAVGETDRAAKLLAEGRQLAEKMPGPPASGRGNAAQHQKSTFAGRLAAIDPVAAEAMVRGWSYPALDWYLAGVARGAAAEDPAAAERLLSQLSSSVMRDRYVPGIAYRMASQHPEQATRMAQSAGSNIDRAYALGMVAHALASTDREAAAKLLNQAIGILQQAAGQQTEANPTSVPIVIAASLLPVAEAIDAPTLADTFWRVLAMRPPRPVRGDSMGSWERQTGSLAILLARYDRQVARALIDPLMPRASTLMADANGRENIAHPLFGALALSDPQASLTLALSIPAAAAQAKSHPRELALRTIGFALANCENWPELTAALTYRWNPERAADRFDER